MMSIAMKMDRKLNGSGESMGGHEMRNVESPDEPSGAGTPVVAVEAAPNYEQFIDIYCKTRREKLQALHVLLRQLAGTPLDREMAIPTLETPERIFAYVVPAVQRQEERLTDDRRAQLLQRGLRATSAR
jgi:hypothetical protein